MEQSFEKVEQPSSLNDDQETARLLPEKQKPVFLKVWAEVEKIIQNLRQVFMRSLEDPLISTEEQGRTIE